MNPAPQVEGGGARCFPARAALFLIGLAWTLPFLQPYHPLPLPSFYSEWLALALGLAALGFLPASSRAGTLPVPVVVTGLLLLAVLFLAHAGIGRMAYPGDAMTAARYLAWAAMLVVLGAWLRRDLGLGIVAAVLAWFLLAGGVASAFAALVQHYRWETPLNFLIAAKLTPEVYGNLGQFGHFAGYMALATVSSVYLYSRRLLSGLWLAPCVAVFLFVLALAGSRATWLYLAVFALLALLLRRHAQDAASSRAGIVVLLLLPAFVLAQWVATLAFMQAPTPSVTSAQRLFELATGTGPRLWLAQVAWDLFIGSPLLGAGLGRLALHSFELSALWGGPSFTGVARHAHNLVLHLMAETGIVGAGLAIATALAWLMNLRRAALDVHHWWLLALLGTLGVHSMLEYPLWYAYFLGIAAILIGVGATACREIHARAGAIITALVVVAGGYFLVTAFAHYRGFERAVYAPHADRAPEARDALIDEQLLLRHRDPVLAPYAELILSRTMSISEDQVRDKLSLNTRVMVFNPVGDVVYRQALLLALAGDRDGAERRLRQLARVFPDRLKKDMAGLRELAAAHPGKLGSLPGVAAAELEKPGPGARPP